MQICSRYGPLYIVGLVPCVESGEGPLQQRVLFVLFFHAAAAPVLLLTQ